MSARGTAHHQRGSKTFPILDDQAQVAERKARNAGRDAAYRALLGIGEGPLPKTVGTATGHYTGRRRGTPF